MTWYAAFNILFAFGVAAVCAMFWVCAGYVRLKCEEHTFEDEQFGKDVRGVLSGIARFSFWLSILSIIKMFF